MKKNIIRICMAALAVASAGLFVSCDNMPDWFSDQSNSFTSGVIFDKQTFNVRKTRWELQGDDNYTFTYKVTRAEYPDLTGHVDTKAETKVTFDVPETEDELPSDYYPSEGELYYIESVDDFYSMISDMYQSAYNEYNEMTNRKYMAIRFDIEYDIERGIPLSVIKEYRFVEGHEVADKTGVTILLSDYAAEN